MDNWSTQGVKIRIIHLSCVFPWDPSASRLPINCRDWVLLLVTWLKRFRSAAVWWQWIQCVPGRIYHSVEPSSLPSTQQQDPTAHYKKKKSDLGPIDTPCAWCVLKGLFLMGSTFHQLFLIIFRFYIIVHNKCILDKRVTVPNSETCFTIRGSWARAWIVPTAHMHWEWTPASVR